MSIKEKALEMLGKGSLVLKAKSPEIMLAAGIALVVGGTVVACKQAVKSSEVVEEVKASLDQVHEEKDALDNKQYSQRLLSVYKRGFLVFARYYLPPMVLQGVGIGLLLKSHGTLKGRYLDAVAAYDGLSAMFTGYRNRVIDELGEEKDQHFMDGTRIEKIKDENGKNCEVTVIDKPPFDGPNKYEFSVILDQRSWPDFDRYEVPLMLDVLQCRLDCLNDGHMKVYKHIFLDRILKEIGYEIDDPEYFIPNIRDHGCINKINYTFKPVKQFDRATGEYDDAIKLTIFTDGNILTKLDEMKHKEKRKNFRIPNVKCKIIKGE